jgi:hypothetical protein
MSLVIELSPTEEAKIATYANQEGVSAPELVRKAVFRYIQTPQIIKEDVRPVGTRGAKVTTEQIEKSLEKIRKITAHVPYDPSVTYDREDIYFDHD